MLQTAAMQKVANPQTFRQPYEKRLGALPNEVKFAARGLYARKRIPTRAASILVPLTTSSMLVEPPSKLGSAGQGVGNVMDLIVLR